MTLPMLTPRASRRSLLVGSLTILLVALTPTASLACDPPYIVDEDTGEFDQEAWDAGVEACARWATETDRPGAAERVAAPVAAGAAMFALGLWARPRRGERDVGDRAWFSNLMPRLWWALATLGLALMIFPLFTALS